MAFHIDQFREWRAGAGSAPKYSVRMELDCSLVSKTATEATFRIEGPITVINYPDNSRNSWPASDFAVLTIAGYDPIDYQFTKGASYYQAKLPALPNAPQSYLNALRVEFRGDTSRADGPNRVSLWTNELGGYLAYNSVATGGTFTFRTSQTFTLKLTGEKTQPVLIYTHSGANNSTDYSWLSHEVWATVFDIDPEPGPGPDPKPPAPTDYRPGSIWNGSQWMSHNRDAEWSPQTGAANILCGGSWNEMRTQEGVNDPPTIYAGYGWQNQAKIGTDADNPEWEEEE